MGSGARRMNGSEFPHAGKVHARVVAREFVVMLLRAITSLATEATMLQNDARCCCVLCIPRTAGRLMHVLWSCWVWIDIGRFNLADKMFKNKASLIGSAAQHDDKRRAHCPNTCHRSNERVGRKRRHAQQDCDQCENRYHRARGGICSPRHDSFARGARSVLTQPLFETLSMIRRFQARAVWSCRDRLVDTLSANNAMDRICHRFRHCL